MEQLLFVAAFQAIQPTTIDNVAAISGGTPCPYSPWRVTVASAANITAQPSAAPHSRVRACASGAAHAQTPSRCPELMQLNTDAEASLGKADGLTGQDRCDASMG